MATLFLFDEQGGACTTMELPGKAQLPHVHGMRVTVEDFTYGARSDVFWTTRSALEALERLSSCVREPFLVRGGFRRIGSASFPLSAPQYAGLALHLLLPHPALAARLAASARECAAFPFVSPPFATGCEVRVSFPCRARFAIGDAGTDVLALQDALSLAGFPGVTLSGQIDRATRHAVRLLQQISGLPATGVPDLPEIRRLARLTSAYQRAKMGNKVLFGTEGPNGL